MEKNYAYLSVAGMGDIAQVSKCLKLEPTKAWSAGDAKPQGGTYPTSQWCYESREFENSDMGKAILAVVTFVASRSLNISALPPNFTACVQCVGYHEKNSPGFHLSRELISQMAAAGLAADFDLYCHA